MLKLALRSVFRQKSHTAMTLAAIMGGVAGLILAGGWVNNMFLTLSEALIHSQSGHLQVYKAGYFAAGSRAPEKYLIAFPSAVKQRVAADGGVANVMARLNFSGLLNNGRSDLPIIGEGVEPGQETLLGSSVSITAGRQLADGDAFGIMLGYGVAQGLKLKPGDYVTLLVNTLDGALNSMDLQVIGVFKSFSSDYDARAVKIPLAATQELLGTQDVNALVVSLKKTDDTDRVAARLKEQLGASSLEVKTWVELNDFYEKAVELYKRQFGFLQLIILIMVVLSVANSVNMTVFERVGEFGTMMALGNRSSQVFRQILIENMLLGVIGSSLGLGLGVALALVISAMGIPMPPLPNSNLGYTAQIQIIPSELLISCAIGTGATILAAVLPARHISRMPVVEALRQNF
ncbi:ABC transporter permease [Nitrosovibrio tenuis]|uniref:Putative ABC transport system permease protein n=1 Tax=Nitrosovibrio tenuis TaxID=1233 RepID=A0A1H7PNG0_9PROT|nr:ABC transporter permease [Nitrosovibrio tenuis]SEL37312.1 putative ABC transport system permease protein [Nitrosovibrio tenuis]